MWSSESSLKPGGIISKKSHIVAADKRSNGLPNENVSQNIAANFPQNKGSKRARTKPNAFLEILLKDGPHYFHFNSFTRNESVSVAHTQGKS